MEPSKIHSTLEHIFIFALLPVFICITLMLYIRVQLKRISEKIYFNVVQRCII